MNIIIIGCGNIGFRHLESILNLDAKKNIYIVDKSDASIDRCKNLLYKNDDQNLSSFFLNLLMILIPI
jgi:saccharopine dehydrogenase-like NADP-dependent oxidoreductase